MEQVEAKVQAVLTGKHGVFVVARSAGVIGSITFSLSEEVWQESDQPEEGAVVILGDLRRKSAGWRAHTARYMRPSDQQQVSSKEVVTSHEH